jgi:hypothetical protein
MPLRFLTNKGSSPFFAHVCVCVWSPRKAGTLPVVVTVESTVRDPVPTLHDLPHTISSHLFLLLCVSVITVALSEGICQVEHLLKNV